MSEVQNALSARAAPPRLRSASGYSKVAATGRKAKESEKNVSVIRSDEVAPSFDTQAAPMLEFVTITGRPTTKNSPETSKQIRTQAMRDYLWKHKQATTGVVKIVENVDPEEPSKYKGRFKLKTWSHRTKATPKHKRQGCSESDIDVVPLVGARKEDASGGYFPSPRLSFSFGTGLDPFSALAVRLVPSSDRILEHYHTSYSMNSVAIHPTGDFFSIARADEATLHSVSFLVALHRDLNCGISGSRDSFHHGGEAFRIINERLQANEGFSDGTIAAVAMLANKENLNGNYHLSKMHMRGLGEMIETRGGVQNLEGVFLRIVTWSDFCSANILNSRPIFPRQTPMQQRSAALDVSPLNFAALQVSDSFGTESPMISIMASIRRLSRDLDAGQGTVLNRLQASHMIYNLEYDLLALNDPPEDDPALKGRHSFEVIPLKTAVHLYLYLFIREIPQTSKIIDRMVARLQMSLVSQLFGWLNSTDECLSWLLWILFMGRIAARGRNEGFWFLQKLVATTDLLGIFSKESLELHLRKITWHEGFCATQCELLWDDIMLFGDG